MTMAIGVGIISHGFVGEFPASAIMVTFRSEPLAFLLTWPTYGSRLHGDPRGSVDDSRNQPETPALPPNERRVRWERSLMIGPIFLLEVEAQRVVESVIRTHCAHRNWALHALAVRSNHVHAVVGNEGIPPERMMSELKAWSTRRLRDAGRASSQQRVWVHHGSTRYLWTPESVAAAVDYVDLAQDMAR